VRKLIDAPRVEIKSNWLRIPKERQALYISQYQITDAELNEFVTELYDILLSYDVTLIASFVNKGQVKVQYAMPQSPIGHRHHFFERIEPEFRRSLKGDYAGFGNKKFP
jgi:hypothetical protein